MKFLIFYKIKCNIIKIITPGIPNIPATKAVIQFNVIEKSKFAPTKLTNQIIIPPNTPFTSNLITNLNGKDNTFKIIYITTKATKKVIINCVLI